MIDRTRCTAELLLDGVAPKAVFERIGVARHLLGGPELLRSRAAELQGPAA